MSFILDALKKAEHARPPASMPQTSAIPALPLEATDLHKRRQRPAWMIAGGGALAALLVAGIAWQVLGESSTLPPAAATAPSRPSSILPANNSAAPAPGASQARAAAPRRDEVRPLDSEARAGQPEPAVTALSPRVASSVPSSGGSSGRVAPGTVVYENLSNERLVQGGTVQYQRNFANEPAPAAASEPASSAGTGGSRQLYNNVKLTGGGLPNLHMDIHVFSEDPGNRFIFINSRKYRQGQTTREGVLIEEITPTGANMSYRGERFSMARN